MAALHFTKDTFQKQVLESKGLVVVDFWATWCNPCQMFAPIVDQVAEQLEGQVVVGKVETSENPDLAIQYGVESIPTVIFFKDGQEVDRSIGLLPKPILLQKINALR